MWTVHGFALVSADDRITDATGATPDSLRNAADWAYFQDLLDRVDVTVLGRIGHQHNPNSRNRRRLVLSTSAAGLEARDDGWWWNPADLAMDAMLAAILPGGGTVAVPGGQSVFDLFLPRTNVFHLSRARDVILGAGRTVFSAVGPGRDADSVLRKAGLRPGARTDLDPAENVTLTLYRRPA